MTLTLKSLSMFSGKQKGKAQGSRFLPLFSIVWLVATLIVWAGPAEALNFTGYFLDDNEPFKFGTTEFGQFTVTLKTFSAILNYDPSPYKEGTNLGVYSANLSVKAYSPNLRGYIFFDMDPVESGTLLAYNDIRTQDPYLDLVELYSNGVVGAYCPTEEFCAPLDYPIFTSMTLDLYSKNGLGVGSLDLLSISSDFDNDFDYARLALNFSDIQSLYGTLNNVDFPLSRPEKIPEPSSLLLLGLGLAGLAFMLKIKSGHPVIGAI